MRKSAQDFSKIDAAHDVARALIDMALEHA